MTVQTLSLRIDWGGVAEELQSLCEVAGYEVTFPDGEVLLYGISDKPMVDAHEAAGFKIEPLYRFKAIETDPNQPGLFDDAHTKVG